MTRAETIAHLRRARERIDRDYATPLDLDALAAEAGFSRFHFARSFAEVYGEPPRAYLTRRRIERAKDLLRSANLTVTEVCLMVGFRSLGSFSARFSELVGISPSAYRSEQVRRGGPPPVPGCFLFAWSRPAAAAAAEQAASRHTASAEKRAARPAASVLQPQTP